MGLGIFEIMILAAIALVVMGPEKFPDFAKIVIRTVRDVRGYMNDVSSEVTKEWRPVQKELNQLARYDANPYQPVKPPPKSASTTTAAAPAATKAPEAQMDAQNVVDPAVAEEKPAAKANSAGGPASGNGDNSNGAALKSPSGNYHASADEYPD